MTCRPLERRVVRDVVDPRVLRCAHHLVETRSTGPRARSLNAKTSPSRRRRWRPGLSNGIPPASSSRTSVGRETPQQIRCLTGREHSVLRSDRDRQALGERSYDIFEDFEELVRKLDMVPSAATSAGRPYALSAIRRSAMRCLGSPGRTVRSVIVALTSPR